MSISCQYSRGFNGTQACSSPSGELFRQSLAEMLNLPHPLVKLQDIINWEEIEQIFLAHFCSTAESKRQE